MNVRVLYPWAVFPAVVALTALLARSDGAESSASKLSRREDSPKPAVLQEEINRALKAAFPATVSGRREQAKSLLPLYTQTAAAEEVSLRERTRLRARLRSRLTRLSTAIARDASQATSASKSSSDSLATGSLAAGEPKSPPDGAAGGAPQNEGQALVDLIQATIVPQSWEVNGGQGTIVYWPAWQVLVVRQTDDVHEQIGGVVHAMRK